MEETQNTHEYRLQSHLLESCSDAFAPWQPWAAHCLIIFPHIKNSAIDCLQEQHSTSLQRWWAGLNCSKLNEFCNNHDWLKMNRWVTIFGIGSNLFWKSVCIQHQTVVFVLIACCWNILYIGLRRTSQFSVQNTLLSGNFGLKELIQRFVNHCEVYSALVIQPTGSCLRSLKAW